MTDTFPFNNMDMDAFLAFIDNHKPHWADDVIQPWDESDRLVKEQFISAHYWCGNASINVFQVVGTAHYQYQGKTWLELMRNGQHMDTNIPLLIKNPTYYSDVKAKRLLMDFKTWDGIHYYVNHEGNHRVALCQLYFHYIGETQIHGVTIDHFKLNDSFYMLFKDVSEFIARHKLSISVNPVKTCCGRDDTAGWKTDYFKTVVTWDDSGSSGVVLTLTESELKAQFDQLKINVHQLNQSIPTHKAWYKRLLRR